MIVGWTWVVTKQLNSRNKIFIIKTRHETGKKGEPRSLISSEEG